MKLPGSVQEIADVLGEERALFLIGQLPRCYNGKQFHVILYVPTPGRMGRDHELVRILGWNDAVKMANHFPGEILHPAPCASLYKSFRDAQIVQLVADGLPTQTAADWFSVSERQVRNLVREIPQEERRAANADNPASTYQGRRKNDKELAAA